MARRVAIVPHTHWDREWYLPFQSFRLRLIDTLDALLPRLEADPSYAHFLLDGQMAVVDDYLSVRPEAEARLERLAMAGRVDVGPWYTLMDEFLVSGETVVRNLQLGLVRAQRLGGAMNLGYLPDMFGHIAQMPQLLELAGIHQAVVWRGVPLAVDKDSFWWQAPDGSTVRALYLVDGYSNGQEIVGDPESLITRLATFEDRFASFLLDAILFMNGSDHSRFQPWLPEVVAQANSLQDEYDLAITSLPDYLATTPIAGLPTWKGELRSGARANLLMGVTSNRIDVRQAAARAEMALERRAEPLCALFLPPQSRPGPLLDEAWRAVVLNAAHDSVCACSADEVVEAVLHRYSEARQIGEGLAQGALSELAASMADEGWVAVNPAARTRGGVLEFDVPGTGPLPGAQVVEERGPIVTDRVLSHDEALAMVAGVHSQQLDEKTFVNAVAVEETLDGVRVTVDAHRELTVGLVMPAIAAGVLARLRARPDSKLHLVVRREPARRIVVQMPEVPGFGWRLVGEVVPPKLAVVATGGYGLTNGKVTVEVDPSDGSLRLNELAGLDRLVDEGDAGDTYNYSPPADDRLVDVPDAVSVESLEAGPVRGRIRVVRRYSWPALLTGGARAGEREVMVTTLVELRAGENFVRITTSFDNPSRDHRLRAHFPLPRPASSSLAGCAFATVQRGLEAEGGLHERPLPTFPARGFVSAGGLTVAHEGVMEYELVEGGRELALTLLRATGMLARADVAYRPLPAGPPMPLLGPQLLGPRQLRYVLSTDASTDPYALVEDAFLPLDVITTKGGGSRPPTGTALRMKGAEVSALKRTPGGLELRVFNPRPETASVWVEGRRGWVIDLRGAPQHPFEERIELHPWGILTLLLAE